MQLGRSDRVVTDLRLVFRCKTKLGIRHAPVLRRPFRSPSRPVNSVSLLFPAETPPTARNAGEWALAGAFSGPGMGMEAGRGPSWLILVAVSAS